MHDFVFNSIFFTVYFFGTLELYSECSRKQKVMCQKQVEAETAAMGKPTALCRVVKYPEQRFSILKKGAFLVSKTAVGCHPLTDEPSEGAGTCICDFRSTSRPGFLAVAPLPLCRSSWRYTRCCRLALLQDQNP